MIRPYGDDNDQSDFRTGTWNNMQEDETKTSANPGSPIAFLLWLYRSIEKAEILKIPWGKEAFETFEQAYRERSPCLPLDPDEGSDGGGDEDENAKKTE